MKHETFLVWDSPSGRWYWICRGCGHVAKKLMTHEATVKAAKVHVEGKPVRKRAAAKKAA